MAYYNLLIYHWTIFFWLINVYHTLLYTQIKNNALFYFKGTHPDFNAMHFCLEFKCSSFRSCVLDFRHWWSTWQWQVSMPCDTVWGVTCHFSGHYDLGCHINLYITQPPDSNWCIVWEGQVHIWMQWPLIITNRWPSRCKVSYVLKILLVSNSKLSGKISVKLENWCEHYSGVLNFKLVGHLHVYISHCLLYHLYSFY